MEAVARAAREAVVYDPDPRGAVAAREALAEFFGGSAEDYWLTASTSEAYSWVFRLMGEPGDVVVAPAPGYPLVEPLARHVGLGVEPYWSHYLEPDGWVVDGETLARALREPRVRALVAVNPGNPTGAYVSGEAREAMVAAAADRGIALVADEVFHPFVLDAGGETASRPARGTRDEPATLHVGGEATARPAGKTRSIPALRGPSEGPPPSFGAESRCITFTLSGVSKILAAPQLKLGWIRLSGPPEPTAPIRAKLDAIADLFLPVSAPVAAALPELLTLVPQVTQAIRARLTANLDTARRLLAGPSWRVRRCDGGWAAVIDARGWGQEDQELAIVLMERAGLAAHPGWFYDLPDPGSLVISLLPRPEAFADLMTRLRRAIAPDYLPRQATAPTPA